MARREVKVLTVPRDDSEPMQIGRMIDPGNGGEPFGTDPNTDRMLNSGGQTRVEKFEYYHAGWSNGYIQTQAA